MSLKNISPEQAKEILESDGNAVYIDVRTEPEFVNGHVPKAVNIPVVWPDPATRQMKPNPDFVNVV
ncbi:MAG: rhodanese-like domain-containing protein, partial [Acidobacteria bacterium]